MLLLSVSWNLDDQSWSWHRIVVIQGVRGSQMLVLLRSQIKVWLDEKLAVCRLALSVAKFVALDRGLYRLRGLLGDLIRNV